MSNENKIPEIIRSSLENIRSMVDANTVIGDPIVAAGNVTIIPVSKVSMGTASGGIDYNPKGDGTPRAQNFGGGGGTGLSVSPVGFIVVDGMGRVEFINIKQPNSTDPVDQIADLVERTPYIIAKIKDIFVSDDKKSLVDDKKALTDDKKALDEDF